MHVAVKLSSLTHQKYIRILKAEHIRNVIPLRQLYCGKVIYYVLKVQLLSQLVLDGDHHQTVICPGTWCDCG